ncbi:MAG: EamA family transporter [Anaerolineales bacterium]|nr:EamA family transporter [Anaerolineales bacterium]
MGELAALGTAVLWSFTSILFTIAGRRVGSLVVNRTRLVIAVILLSSTHLLLEGTLFPQDIELEQGLWLGLSGLLGLVLGDAFLFQSLVLVGARLSMLMMALVPVLSTLFAWIFLGEHLSSMDLAAIGLTVLGIAWVVWEANNQRQEISKGSYGIGIFFGFLGALGQSLGLITAKRGLSGDISALSAVLVRMLVAMIVLWILTILLSKARETILSLKDTKALRAIIGASIVGPFLGVWLSIVAIDQTHVGIASTLMALSPIILLPLTHWVFKEKISGRTIFGTVTACAGVAMIFLAS